MAKRAGQADSETRAQCLRSRRHAQGAYPSNPPLKYSPVSSSTQYTPHPFIPRVMSVRYVLSTMARASARGRRGPPPR